jgi:hypothetical protein
MQRNVEGQAGRGLYQTFSVRTWSYGHSLFRNVFQVPPHDESMDFGDRTFGRMFGGHWQVSALSARMVPSAKTPRRHREGLLEVVARLHDTTPGKSLPTRRTLRHVPSRKNPGDTGGLMEVVPQPGESLDTNPRQSHRRHRNPSASFQSTFLGTVLTDKTSRRHGRTLWWYPKPANALSIPDGTEGFRGVVCQHGESFGELSLF